MEFKISFLAASFIMARLAFGLDLKSLGENSWLRIHDDRPGERNNETYEADLTADPLLGLLWVGPGHRGSNQDNHWYIFDVDKYDPAVVPSAAAWLNWTWGLPGWSSPHTSIRPPKKCLSKFCFSEQDLAILHLGGGTYHQSSIGTFDSAYRNINDVLRTKDYGLFAYSLPENKWRQMRTAGRVAPQTGSDHFRFKYDPVHDVCVTHGGGSDYYGISPMSQTWVYHYHYNEWHRISSAVSPGRRHMYAADMDTRNGVFYLLGGSAGDAWWGTWVPEMWALNLDTETWSKISGTQPGGAPGYTMSMAYSPLDHALFYLEGLTGYKLWVFDIRAQQWSVASTPALAPADPGILAFSGKHNLLFLLGGKVQSADYVGRLYNGLWAYRYKTHNLDSIASAQPRPSADISTRGGIPVITWPKKTGITYNVYRALARPYPKNFVRLNGSPLSAASFSDNSAERGEWYSYRVSAVTGGVEGALSRHLYTRPGRPLDVAVSVESVSQVIVSWVSNPENDIVGYNIYRARGPQIFDTTFRYQKLNSQPLSDTAFIDKFPNTTPDLSDGVARGYVVTAVNAYGCESGPSQAVTTFPPQVEWFRAYKKSGNIFYKNMVEGPGSGYTTFLTWQPISRTRVAGYQIAGAGGVITDTVSALNGSGNYMVRAVNVLGQQGYFSDILSAGDANFTNGDGPLDKFDFKAYPGAGPSTREESFKASQAHSFELTPNPLTPGSILRIDPAPFASRNISIFNVQGALVKRFDLKGSGAGKPREIQWKTSGMPAGVYFIRLETGRSILTRQAVLIN